MHILRAKDHRRMRWKNGLGETTEIAVSPEGASLDAFDWRVSMAQVAADGPFSAFPGIDRTLCVLDGEGIVLAIAGRPEVTLTRASEPFSFPADAETAGRLVKGKIADLNVMTRRGRFRRRVRRLAIDGSAKLRFEADLTLLLSRADGLSIAAGSRHETLDTDDAVIFDEPNELTLGSVVAVAAFAVELHRAK
jgi:environmental stress-induced protein Ves